MIELNKVHESIFTGNQVAKPSGCRVRPQHPHFLAKRPPKPPKPPFFFGGMATVFLLPVPLPVPFFPSTFLRIGPPRSSPAAPSPPCSRQRLSPRWRRTPSRRSEQKLRRSRKPSPKGLSLLLLLSLSLSLSLSLALLIRGR
ncbi:hypothetical protein EUGRSUZ_J01935 [Eucalyptus grandis]|uniref:Uncharacterized protein n=2 Tax=Eucalyptus grandis TaxID=71139 RepID=A0A059AGP9_EUCGR|nr:hypothetical protein EUGRSUZ_J01935 [Eucalyptus grandis]